MGRPILLLGREIPCTYLGWADTAGERPLETKYRKHLNIFAEQQLLTIPKHLTPDPNAHPTTYTPADPA